MTDASLAAILEIYAITSGLQVRRAMERSDIASENIEHRLILLRSLPITAHSLLILLSSASATVAALSTLSGECFWIAGAATTVVL